MDEDFSTDAVFIRRLTGFYAPFLSLIAVNGDELWLTTWTDVTYPPAEDDPPNIIERWDAAVEFIGGTGRFEDASGEARYIGYNYFEGDLIYCHAVFRGVLSISNGSARQ